MWACVSVPAPTDSACHPPGLSQARGQHSPVSKQPSPAWSTQGEKASVVGPSPYLPHRGILPFHPRACGPNRTQSLGRQQLWASLPLPDPVFCFSHACLKVDEVVIVSGLPSALCSARFAPGLLMQPHPVQGPSEQEKAGASAVFPHHTSTGPVSC